MFWNCVLASMPLEFTSGQWLGTAPEVTLGHTCHEVFFANNFWPKKTTALNLAPFDSSRQDGSDYVHNDLKRSTFDLDLTWPQLKVTVKVKQVILHIVRFALTRQTRWYHFYASMTNWSRVIGENVRRPQKHLLTSLWRHKSRDQICNISPRRTR